jgi:DNA-binding beta-propeller fold protein YncE
MLYLKPARRRAPLIFDLDAHKVISAITIGSGPDSIAFDHALHRLYIAGKSGFLSVVQQNSPDKYELIDSIHTHYGAYTLVLYPATHRVYVGFASILTAPHLAVFAPKSAALKP